MIIGGRAALSEQLLLHALGIPMKNVLQIATINSAKAIGRDKLYGSIEKGKKADLIIFTRAHWSNRTTYLVQR